MARYYDPNIGRFISPDTFVQRADGFDIVTSPLTVNYIPGGLGSVLAPHEEYPAVSFELPANPQSLNRYSYVLNNPLKYIDPNGWRTQGHGVNVSLGFGIGISIEILWVTDDSGNRAIAVNLSFLGTTPTASAGYQYQDTSAGTVSDLAGWSGGGGASTGKIPTPLPSGGEYIGSNQGNAWTGYNVSTGFQWAPAEVHAVVGFTWLFGKNMVDTSPSVNMPSSINSDGVNTGFTLWGIDVWGTPVISKNDPSTYSWSDWYGW